jgi:electron transfer flavoprotein alpha subunit
METILFLAHTDDSKALPKNALEALAAAKALAEQLGGANFAAGLFGEGVRVAADVIAGSGAARVLGVSGAEFAQPRYSTDAAAAEALVRAAGASIVIAPATSRMSRVLAGVAQRCGGRIDTHAAGISVADGAVRLTRWYYRQRMVATLERTHRPWFISVDPGSIAPYDGAPGTANLEPVSLDTGEELKRTRVEGVKAPSASQQTIRSDADLLFVAGAGWTKKQRDGQAHVQEADGLILDFLAKSGASLGGSKSIVDQSGEGSAVLTCMTHLNQVGQTGSTPRHPKGLAACCHGEEPHVVGWRFINERRAVNLDPNCGWAHGKADVVYVADAFEVVKKVNEILGA